MRIIKSLEYNRDEYLLLYWCFFPPPPLSASFCSRVNFRTTFRISFILAAGFSYRLPDYISVNFPRDLNLELQGQTQIFHISAKNYPIATKRIANISIEHWASNMTSVVTSILELSKSIMEFAILQQKWPDCNEMKSKHIDLTSGLKYVEFDLGHDRDLAFSRSKFLFVIPYYIIPGYEIVGFEQCVIMRPRSHMLIVRRKIEPVKTSDYFIFLGVIDNVAFW